LAKDIPMTAVMQGFPPLAEHQATLANWRTAPYCEWAFHHVREVIPSTDIPNDPANVLPLTPGETIDAGLAETASETDAIVVLQGDKVLFESYRNGMGPRSPHILMSVSKTMLGLLCGALAGRGLLDPEATVESYLPEMAATAFAGATLRQMLDMRVGVIFDEDYLATSGPIVEYRKATNWNPLGPGEAPGDLRSFFATLTESSGPHGGPVHYASPVPDLLAWNCERATGTRFADLLSEYLWRPMGAETSAYITVDRLGAPRAAGGVCTTARDLARLGLLVARGGMRDGAEVIPAAWIEDLFTGGDAAAWAAGDLAVHFPALPMRYRSYCYIVDGDAPLLSGLGIHGQHLFVDPARELSIAVFASKDAPLDLDRTKQMFAMVERVRAEIG
jgi:CubicO group peptidase (beta-lactamase class C family)